MNCDIIEVRKRLFGNNIIDIYPTRGLENGGSYAIPEHIKKEGEIQILPIIIYPKVSDGEFQQFKNQCIEFTDNLGDEFKKYFGVSLSFNEWEEIFMSSVFSIEDLATLNKKLSKKLGEWRDRYGDDLRDRCVILLFAKYTPEYQKLTPYYLSKCIFNNEIPSQVVTERALENFEMSLANVSLGIFAKLGGIPWVLSSPLPSNVIVGVGRTIVKYRVDTKAEQVESYIGSVALITSEGVVSKTRAKVVSEKEELISWISRNIEKAVESFVLSKGEKEASLSVHYSGKRPSKEELEALKRTIEELKGKGIRVSYKILHITSDINLRLLCEKYNYYPRGGLYCIASEREAYLTPLGAIKIGKDKRYPFTGIPRTLKVSLIETSENSILDELKIGLREVYDLTYMHIAGTQININEPITTKYSRELAYLVSSLLYLRRRLGIECLRPYDVDVYERPWFL
jgi:hypothetical protein